MVKRIIIIGSGIIVVILLAISIYKIATFSLFDNKLCLIDKFRVNKNYSLAIYSFPSSATIQGSIQVHMKYVNGNEKLLENYDRFNKLISYKIQNGNTLMLVLQDTLANNMKPDTFYLKLPFK